MQLALHDMTIFADDDLHLTVYDIRLTAPEDVCLILMQAIWLKLDANTLVRAERGFHKWWFGQHIMHDCHYNVTPSLIVCGN